MAIPSKLDTPKDSRHKPVPCSAQDQTFAACAKQIRRAVTYAADLFSVELSSVSLAQQRIPDGQEDHHLRVGFGVCHIFHASVPVLEDVSFEREHLLEGLRVVMAGRFKLEPETPHALR